MSKRRNGGVLLTCLLSFAAAVAGCGDDDDDDGGGDESAALDSCRRVCDAIEEEGCLEVEYPTLESCKDNCNDLMTLSAECQQASLALDECRLSRTTLCDDINATEDCGEELDALVTCN
jgi:hypothetical protein